MEDEYKVVSVRITVKLKNKLEDEATQEHRSFSQQVAKILEEHYK